MIPFITCHLLTKSYGPKKLFENLSFVLQEGDKVGLIGPNGAGKTTLLKILSRLESADSGSCAIPKGRSVAYVPQVPDYSMFQTVHEVIRHQVSSLHLSEEEKDLSVAKTSSLLGFSKEDVELSSLSGGWKKRLSLACALVTQPDFLVLDEPTNHLDLEGILWLEKFLGNPNISFLMVSHDRTFLDRTVKKVMELNHQYPQGFWSVEGNYSNFIIKKNEFLENQQQLEAVLKSKFKQELEWLRRSPKARTTKSQSRIDRAHDLKALYHQVQAQNKTQSALIDFQASDRRTKELVVLKDVSKAFGDNVLFENLNFTVSAGMHVGLCGSNGSGKSTLLKLILGELEPDQGEITRASDLKILYFDQHRQQLDPHSTLKKMLCSEGDQVIVQGEPMHVISWARKFLFRPEQLESKIHTLSGGEQARALLAKMMLETADLLILDEPTNDLDLPTLEILEENLLAFSGAILMVTHDRYLLDRLCKVLLGFQKDGGISVFADTLQWEADWKLEKEVQKSSSSQQYQRKKAVLSSKEKKELDTMEETIQAIEEEVQVVEKQLQDPKIASDSTQLLELCALLEKKKARIEGLYIRWGELEEKKHSGD